MNSLRSARFKSSFSSDAVQAEGHVFHSNLAYSKWTRKSKHFKVQLSNKGISNPWLSRIQCPTSDTQFWRKTQWKNEMWLHSLLLKRNWDRVLSNSRTVIIISFQATSPIYCYYCKAWLWDHICTFRILTQELQTLKFRKPSNYWQLPQMVLKEHTESEHLKNHLVPFQTRIFNGHTHKQLFLLLQIPHCFITERIHAIS